MEGVEPTSPEGNRVTAGDATNYALHAHLKLEGKVEIGYSLHDKSLGFPTSNALNRTKVTLINPM